MNLDDLLKSVREDEFLTPKDAAGHKKKISSEKFFNIAQELKSEGTIQGQPVSPEQRKEGFKKSRDPVEFKKFVEKVLARKKDAGGDGVSTKPKNQKLLTGATFKALPGDLSSPPDIKSDSSDEDKPKRKKSLLTFVKQINNRVGGILKILDKRADVEADASKEKAQETEKAKRGAKEAEGEKKKMGIGLPGPIAKMAAPVTSLFDNIIKTIGQLLLGWGLVKFLKWLQDPKNKKAVEEFKDFITVAVPAILKGILAVVGFNIVATLVKFTAGLVVGAGKLLLFLGKLAGNLIKWAAKNKRLAFGLGLAAMAGLAINAVSNKREKKKQEEGTKPGTEERDAIDVEDKVNRGEIPPKTETNVKAFGGGLIPDLMGGIQGRIQEGQDKVMDQREQMMGMMGGMGNNIMDTMGGLGGRMIGGVQNMAQEGQDKAMAQREQMMQMMSMMSGFGGKMMGGVQNMMPMLMPQDDSQKMSGGGLVKPITIKPMNINVQKLQGGGRVNNQGGETSPEAEGTDTVPAMLTPGEFVMSRGAVNKWGINTLENMNAAGGGTNKPKITQKVYARGGGRVPMVYARGGGMVDGWSTSKTVNRRTSIWSSIKGTVSGAAGKLKNFFSGGKSKDAEQLISSPPSGGGGKPAIVPIPIPKTGGGVAGKKPVPDEPLFNPIDQNNLSTLVTKSMYSILD